MEKGICYGVSVGPGDPELLTIKAVNILKNSDVIFLPSYPKEDCRVYKIIKAALPEISEEKYVCVNTKPMADPKIQGDRYDILANEVSKYLDDGKTVSFPALGEVCLYSTYFYVHERLVNKGYNCQLISGISSVQASFDRLLISMAQGDEQVHIFPDSKDIKNRIAMDGTKIFMKPKGDLSETIRLIRECAMTDSALKAYGISNYGTENEVVAHNISELDKLNGYMTVIIVI